MMAYQTLLLLVYSSLFIVSLQQSVANKSSYCTSSCGIIPNISYPFRLKHDPKHCGDSKFELACEDNVTLLYLNSHKYYVKQIDYYPPTPSGTIRVVDASINIDDICSFPNSSAYQYNFSDGSVYPYRTYYQQNRESSPINLMSCPHPLKDSFTFTDITHCHTHNSANPRFYYIKMGETKYSEVAETCRVDFIVMTSMEFNKSLANVSLEEIHRALLYGFQLNICPDCFSRALWERLKSFILGARVLLLIPLAIVVFVSAGVSFPVMIIVGFACGLILLFTHLEGIYALGVLLDRNWMYVDYNIAYSFTGKLSGVISIITICIPKFFICPLIAWLLIYKFRRRHLSMYEAIESFLQSNNNLMPIRYKYSDIHKMTKGFQDKLGEGGYGSVYKGKLRSGYHVAVKLLGKSSANSQDFMNET